MAKWKVTLAVRPYGAIGVYTPHTFVVVADDADSAPKAAIELAHARKLETNPPTIVERILIRGTSHFVTLVAARNYYRPYEPDITRKQLAKVIDGKIQRGEIHIGPPKLRQGETLSVDQSEGRYFIEG